MVETAFVTHFPIPPIYPYLPFTPGYLISMILYNYKCKQKIIYNYNYSYFALDGICVLNVPFSSVVPS